MASDWIIIGALVVLATIVFLFFKSISSDGSVDPGNDSTGRTRRRKGAPQGH